MTSEKSVQFSIMRTVGILSVLLALTGCGSSASSTTDFDGTGGEGSSETGGKDSRDNTGGDDASSGGSNNTGGDESTGGNEPKGSGGRKGTVKNTGGAESTGGSDNTGGVVSTGGTGGIVDGTGGVVSTGGTGGTTMECEPGDQKCTDLDIEICNDEGQWEVSQSCPFVCDFDQMFGAQCIGTCEPGAKQCSVEGYAEVCNDYGIWSPTEICPNACVDGECVGSCEPSATQCAGDNVQFCNSNGSWDVVDTCEFVCSGGDCIGVCEPGSVDCVGDTPRTCNAQGQWVSGNECPFMCSAGSCTGSCEPGAKKCTGSGTQTCNSQGQWASVVACPASAHETASCSGAGVCGKSCESGFADCTGAAGCESDLTAVSTCGTCNNNCNSNPAHAAPICTAQGCGMVCNDGWGDLNGNAADGCEHNVSTDAENCGSVGNSCYGGSCTAGVCEFEGIEEIAYFAKEVGVGGSFMAMTQDSAYLYAAYGNGDIVRFKKDGTTAPTVLASEHYLKQQGALVVEGGEVFWSSDCGGRSDCTTARGIYKVSTSGGTPLKLTSSAPEALDVEDGYVYWNTGISDMSTLPYNAGTTTYSAFNADVSFYRVATDKSSTNFLGLSYAPNGAFANIKVVGDKIYFVTLNGGTGTKNRFHFRLVEYNISAWTLSRIISGGVDHTNGLEYFPGGFGSMFPMSFTIEGNYLYWKSQVRHFDAFGDTGLGDDMMARVDLTSSNPSANNTRVTSNNGSFQFAVDSSHLYYTSNQLFRADVTGSDAEALTPYQGANLVNVDANFVYWATWNFDGQGNTYVFRTAK